MRFEIDNETDIKRNTKIFFFKSTNLCISFRKKTIIDLEKPKIPTIPPVKESVIQPIRVALITVFTIPDRIEI